jgi:large subunit ribosomal protein L4
MYKSAMRSILSNLAKENKIFISQDLELASPKTKELSLKLKEIGFEKGLIIYKELSDNMRLASRNIANLEVIGINSLNPISLLNNNSILIDNDCLKNLEELYT